MEGCWDRDFMLVELERVKAEEAAAYKWKDSDEGFQQLRHERKVP